MNKFILRKCLVLLFIFILVNSSIFALSLDQILEGAMKNDLSYQNLRLNYEINKLQLDLLKEKDKPYFSLSINLDPVNYTKYKTVGNIESEINNYGIYLKPSFNYLSSDRKTEVKASLDYSSIYNVKDSNAYNLGLAISHTFDFSSFSSSVLDDLNFASTSLSVERANSYNALSYKKTVLTTIKGILTLESSINESELLLEQSERNFDNLKSLKTYSEDSVTFIESEKALDSQRKSLEELKAQYNLYLDNFKTVTGLTWDSLDSLPEPNLTIRILKEGNTEVQLKSLASSIAKENYDKKYAEIYPNKVTLSASANSSFTNSFTPNKTSVSAGVTYEGRNWSIGATPNVVISSSSSPSITSGGVTITGTWHNSVNNQAEITSLMELQNKEIIAQNEYLQALSEYNQKGQNLLLDIMKWRYSYSSLQNQMSINKNKLESQKISFSKGLSTKDDLDKAELETVKDKYKMDSLILDGLILECDIAIYSL